MRRLNQVQTAFDTFDSLLKTVHAPVHASETFFHMSHAHFEIVKIVGHPFGALIDPTKHDQDDVLGFISHDLLPLESKYHRIHSAASTTGSGCGLAVYCSMRRSISGRK